MGAVLLAWGEPGARKLATVADVVVLVDVLRFTSAVSLACHRGLTVGVTAEATGELLCPARIDAYDGPEHVVIGSVNGSAIAAALSDVSVPVVAGSLVNARAVADHVAGYDVVAVIPCGELTDAGLRRPAFEDAIGAGAIASYLPHTGNPAVDGVRNAFAAATAQLGDALALTVSGQELHQRNHADDVARAAELDSVPVVPVLTHGVFRA